MFFNRPIPIPMEDDLVHTDDHPVCDEEGRLMCIVTSTHVAVGR